MPIRPAPAEEDDERGLEGVLGVLVVAEGPAAHAEDHRPVPADQLAEGGLVAAGADGRQEVGVRRLPGHAEGSDDGGGPVSHGASTSGSGSRRVVAWARPAQSKKSWFSVPGLSVERVGTW